MAVFLTPLSVVKWERRPKEIKVFPSDNMLICSTELNITVYDKEMRKSAKKNIFLNINLCPHLEPHIC